NKKQLKNIRKASYLNIFHFTLGIKKLLYSEKVLDEFKFIKEYGLFHQYLTDSINSVKKMISGTNEKKYEEEYKNLEIKRERLYTMYLILEGYYIAISYVSELINEYGIRLLYDKQYNNNPYDFKKIEGLIKRIDQTLSNNKNNYEMYIHIISEIISIL